MKSTTAQLLSGSPNHWLRMALGLPEGDAPFPWQEELLKRFRHGTVERSLDIPTGLGKTAVMAIWLVARAYGAALPRRLVYVVDRRAVVDQATDVAEGLRKCVDDNPELKQALGLWRPLPISTLRGQHVDNKEWLEDPASLAIIVGTVDMIGSRLLFEGYGTSRKMRPYHAGLLGVDTLVVLDEAHLVPPFEELLETITDEDAVFSSRDEALRNLIPPFKLLSLSATGRTNAGSSFTLQAKDLEHPVVHRRLNATKRLTVLSPLNDPKELADALAKQAWKLTSEGSRPARCIVFCDKREVAAATKEAIEKLAAGDKKREIPRVTVDTELFVGGRRIFEREGAARRLKQLGFIAGSKVERAHPAFVVATSAGEVGVDLDADHMVSDLVAWERMVQRLGRVNRCGDGEAEVIVIVEPEPPPKKAVKNALAKDPSIRDEKESKAVATYEASIRRTQAWTKALDRLPRKENTADASPGALHALKSRAETDPELKAILDIATTPAPLRPALSRALVDAWSMTSLKEHTGRPEIDPWLRGWIDDDPPQTAVVWRTHLPVRTGGDSTTKAEIETFFEAAPPHASEMLETEAFRVIKWLAARAKVLIAASSDHASIATQGDEKGKDVPGPRPLCRDDVAGVALTAAGDLRTVLRIEDLLLADDDNKEAKKSKADLERNLSGATLIVDARIGGLKDGLLSDEAEDSPRTVDDGEPWVDNGAATSKLGAPVIPFRVRSVDAGHDRERNTEWQECLRFATEVSEDGEPVRCLIVENAATEERRATGRPQLVDEHQVWAEERARDLAHRLHLPDLYAEMLAVTASLHDEGKRTRRWQRAFNAKRDGREYAKTHGPINYALLDGYRHEFGSLPVVEKNARFAQLPGDIQELALHLIAAHHGFGRPIIGTSGCGDAPPSLLEERAQEVALRFARLQKRWGPWGLAWWESLLRAADQQASRDNDAAETPAAGSTGSGR